MSLHASYFSVKNAGVSQHREPYDELDQAEPYVKRFGSISTCVMLITIALRHLLTVTSRNALGSSRSGALPDRFRALPDTFPLQWSHRGGRVLGFWCSAQTSAITWYTQLMCALLSTGSGRR